jgi:hypothetical protein
MKFFCKGYFPNTMHLPPPPTPLSDKKFPCGGSKIGDKDFYEVDIRLTNMVNYNVFK